MVEQATEVVATCVSSVWNKLSGVAKLVTSGYARDARECVLGVALLRSAWYVNIHPRLTDMKDMRSTSS
eukprot:12925789-Prorocentrum_lima.AAC.1